MIVSGASGQADLRRRFKSCCARSSRACFRPTSPSSRRHARLSLVRCACLTNLTQIPATVPAVLRLCARLLSAGIRGAVLHAGACHACPSVPAPAALSDNSASQTSKISDTSQPVILRIAAASYIASFLVRRRATHSWHLSCSSQSEFGVFGGRREHPSCHQHSCCSTWCS